MPSADHELQPFRCEVEPDRAAVRVRPVGELDLATVPIVEAQLAELWSVGFTHLVLDMREVVFLDSTGVRLLVSWHAHGSADGVVFGVIPGPPPVQRVLEIAGVADHLTYWSPNGSAHVEVSREASTPTATGS
jgi:anti-anti-sigma factor